MLIKLSNLLWQFLIHDFRFCKIISWWATHWVYNLQIFIIQDIYNLYNASKPPAHLTRTWRTPLFGTGWRWLKFKTITFLETLSWVSLTNPRRQHWSLKWFLWVKASKLHPSSGQGMCSVTGQQISRNTRRHGDWLEIAEKYGTWLTVRLWHKKNLESGICDKFSK